jgi:toxin ParE1/3/4
LRLVWARPALDDLAGIRTFIARDDPAIADDFVRRLRRAAERLRSFPESGASRDDIRATLRSIPFERYVLFYRLEQDRLLVLRVLHSARDVSAIFDQDQ